MKRQILLGMLCYMLLFSACEKAFLDKKPDISLVVPASLDNLQALLDNEYMNELPGLNIVVSDEFFRYPEAIQTRIEVVRNSYVWKLDYYPEGICFDWEKAYRNISYANTSLDVLKGINLNENNEEKWKHIQGSSLFYRGMNLFHLAQQFTVPYRSATAHKENGLPIRLEADIDIILGRGTLQDTYDQIIKDLTESADLLTIGAKYKSRPSKEAALSLLARVYLSIGDYDKALEYSTKSMKINNSLLDYNTLDFSANSALPDWRTGDNHEVIFFAKLLGYSFENRPDTYIASELFKEYDDNDLRKTIFFNDNGTNNYTFGGSYSGSSKSFGGLAVDELYFIRAECYARKGEIELAMKDLNDLLLKRWKHDTFNPIVPENKEDALTLILRERKKELIGRGLRWGDLRRLNLEPRFEITLTRETLDGEVVLKPNDPRYTFLIPENEIAISGIEQNRR